MLEKVDRYVDREDEDLTVTDISRDVVPLNWLRVSQMTHLDNDFIVMRHGESFANLRGAIAGSDYLALRAHGLTKDGVDQVVASAQDFAAQVADRIDDIVIVASPLLRAKQTGLLLARELGIDRNEVITENRLRERNHGQLEGTNVDILKSRIYPADELDPTHELNGVESEASTVERLSKVMLELNATHRDRIIVLVGHSGPGLTFHRIVSDRDPLKPNDIQFRHDPIKPFGNAEMRVLGRELGQPVPAKYLRAHN